MRRFQTWCSTLIFSKEQAAFTAATDYDTADVRKSDLIVMTKNYDSFERETARETSRRTRHEALTW